MGFLKNLFSRKKEDIPDGFEVIDGKVIFRSGIGDTQTGESKEFGALVFVGMVSGEPSFIPAKIESPDLPPFHHLRADRFIDGIYQKDIIPSVAADEPFNPDFKDGTSDKSRTEPDTSAKTESVRQDGPVPHLPAPYPPSYIAEGLASDLGGFLDYLKSRKLSKETLAAYSLDIRLWNQRLEGDLSPEKIKDVLHKFNSVSRRNRMLSALKTYGKYRLIFGDLRITMILSTSPEIKKVKQIPRPRKILPREIMETYLLQAENLCRAGDRNGIWMGLSLYGFLPSEFARIKATETSGNRMNRLEVRRSGKKTHKVSVPMWLFRAMSELPKKKWGASRNIIHRGLQRYGTFPKQLYNAVADNADPDTVRRRSGKQA